jgi:initiation factor 1A
MYQSAIRNKKKSVNIVKNYILDTDNEEYALCIKLLGNCRIALITNSGNDAIGIIRGNMRKFNKRIIIEVGDIVAISNRDFQVNKVDIVHKYNIEQTQNLINNKELSDVLINKYYSNSHKTDKCDDAHIIFDNNDKNSKSDKVVNNANIYVDLNISSDSDDQDDI